MAFVILTLPLLSIAKGIGYGNTKWDMNPSEVVAAQGNGAHLISSEKYKDNFGKVRIDGNDSNLLIVFYVQIMPDDFVMQLHRF